MKSKLVGFLAVAAVVVLVIAGWQSSSVPAATAGARTVSVTGEAEVRVVPDEVVLTLGIETHDKDLALAKSHNDAIVKKVLAAAAALAIAPEHVQTDYLDIEPRYQNGYYEASDFVGFFVYKSVVITLADLSQFEALLTGALDAGVNYVQGIEFRTTELRRYRDEARALAIRAAAEKAGALAGELDQKAGRPQLIQEQQSSAWSGYGAWWGSRWGGAMTQNTVQEYQGAPLSLDSSVAPGQISIRATIAVSFELTD